jgi:acyl carrier protein
MSTVSPGAALDRLFELVAAVLDAPVDEVAPEVPFADLGADSLQTIEIVVRIDREFGLRLDADEAATVRSLVDAMAVLERKGVLSGSGRA